MFSLLPLTKSQTLSVTWMNAVFCSELFMESCIWEDEEIKPGSVPHPQILVKSNYILFCYKLKWNKPGPSLKQFSLQRVTQIILKFALGA